MFEGIKDRLVSSGAKAFMNQKIANFGELTQLDVDTQARTVHATLFFKGEPEPVELHVADYFLYERDGKCFAQMGSFKSSKPWLTEAAKGLIVGMDLKISRKFYDTLKMLL